MMSSAVLIFTIVILSATQCLAGDEPESLMSEAMRHMGSCSEKVDINMGVCSKMLNDDADRSDAKFDNCKAFGVCISEGFGTMKGNAYDFDKMEEHKKRISSEEYREEADKVLKECRDVAVGKDQNESLINMATCVLTKSPKFKEIVLKIAKSFGGSDDDGDESE